MKLGLSALRTRAIIRVFNMKDQDPYFVRLRNGDQSEICIGSIATRKLKSNLTILRQLVDEETLATHEIPALPIAATRICIRNFISNG